MNLNMKNSSEEYTCPNCHGKGLRIFYEVNNVPVHSVLLMPTREEAIGYKKGDIKLGFCNKCGFISNLVFDPAKHEYSSRYEETQGFSGTFNKFHKNLAQGLIDKYDIRNKEVIEIGCGKGEFLTMICELGNNKGYGFDPAYVPDRNTSNIKDKIEFITDLYSEKYTNYHGDFVACKMTLEHIPDTLNFLRIVRRSIADRLDSIVFFQVPDMERVLSDIGFWDIYYEHCSYFSLGSLARAFKKAGFDPIDLYKGYDDQYLMIETKPVTGEGKTVLSVESDIEKISEMVDHFENKIYNVLDQWRDFIKSKTASGEKVALWGGGSKAVAFLTTLGIVDEIKYAVDINPYKHGTFLAGTGQEIVSPEFLKREKPEHLIVMNPIYIPEITDDLNKLGLHPNLIPIDHF